MGAGFFFRGKADGAQADSPPSSAEIKKEWSYTLTSPHIFIAWHLVKYQEQLYLTVTKNIYLQSNGFPHRNRMDNNGLIKLAFLNKPEGYRDIEGPFET
jgi:hypothetical protein